MNDLARIFVKGGDGGDGRVSFRHEKFAPKGGPDGGDGGRGGDAIMIADENLRDLVAFNFTKKYISLDGEKGLIKKMHGKDSKSTTISVPVGTVVWEIPEEMAELDLRKRENFEQVIALRKLLIDMDTHGKSYVVAYGGKGGRGNDHFKSSTNQTPQQFEAGQPGESKWLLLEHKVVAQIGIVGLPNVGKSSILKALTRANPKIAGYPFTTLEPNLGVTNVGDARLIMVDVPGVIEEAYEGKGIGPWFMRHLERTQKLVHVLAPDTNHQTPNINNQSIAKQLINDYEVVRKEMEKYGNGLPEKLEIVVINKMELIDEKERDSIGKAVKAGIGKEVVWVSAGMGEVDQLVKRLV